MIKFFKPEDIEDLFFGGLPKSNLVGMVVLRINEKLEREGAVVYGEGNTPHGFETPWLKCDYTKYPGLTQKALLICIENVERCLHPPEKIQLKSFTPPLGGLNFEPYCECGQRMKQVVSYEVVK